MQAGAIASSGNKNKFLQTISIASVYASYSNKNYPIVGNEIWKDPYN